MTPTPFRPLALVALAALSAQPGPSSAAGQPGLVRQGIEAGREYVPGELLVQFTANASADDRKAVLRHIGGMDAEVIVHGNRRGQREGDLALVHVPAAVLLDGALGVLAGDPAVEFAEPNWVYHREDTSDDPLFTGGSLWGMYGDASSPANAYGSQAAEAWANGHTCGNDVYVGIIDEGVMYEHEDLAPNMWVNPFDPPDGIDNDGNGYVDDTRGWDFANNDNSTFDGVVDDHGTHVAGTIAATGGNGLGVAGVCWHASVITAKFLGKRGGTTDNAIRAVDYLTDLKTRHGLNIVADNNSWGGGGYSQALHDAIARADAAGILFVVAAGNSTTNIDVSPSYPASYDNPNIITVAAITSSGALASYSNYGANSVDIGAPGSAIYSTVPVRVRRSTLIISSYASYSGTSMATPHVTGAALLYASSHPGATHLQIRQAILDNAIPTPSLAGKTATGGRLNAGGF